MSSGVGEGEYKNTIQTTITKSSPFQVYRERFCDDCNNGTCRNIMPENKHYNERVKDTILECASLRAIYRMIC